MSATIVVNHLTRVYRSPVGLWRRRSREIRALDDVSFAVERGELFGLLGPNGAGKTTLTKILATILLPTAGSARVLDFDVATEAQRCRPHLGLVFGGDRGLYWRLSGWANLDYYSALYHVPSKVAHRRIAEVLDLVGLQMRAAERVENYSRGMRQRLHIARALVHDPSVLIMDEPTLGLDPVAARELRTLIRGLAERGKTIFLTTHYMHEADELCDRVAILHRGKIILCGAPRALKELVRDLEVIEVELFGMAADVAARLRALPSVSSVVVQNRDHAYIIQVQSVGGTGILPRVLACLDGLPLGKVTSREPTLEDAYLRLIGSDGYEV